MLLNGVKESKRVTNFFTALKVSIVMFMLIAGFCYVRPSNWRPFSPYGAAGVFRGASGTFFGYLGYDQVSCLAEEVQDPKKTLPRAIVGVLVFGRYHCGELWVYVVYWLAHQLLSVTFVYVAGTFVLTGMQPYDEISPVSGFPAAFYSVDASIAAEITALGEIVTLPIVVLITIMTQPRLQYAMSVDGLLPPVFREVDGGGNLWKGTLVSGVLMVLIATFVPFENLNDMISCAVLTALSITDTSLVLLWHEVPDRPESTLTEKLMATFHVCAFAASFLLSYGNDSAFANWMTVLSVLGMFTAVLAINFFCPKSVVFGGHRAHSYGGSTLLKGDGYFRTPWLPWWPCIGIFVNWYLIAQLELTGALGLGFFFLIAIVYYFTHAFHHSVGNTVGWEAPVAPSSAVRDEASTAAAEISDRKTLMSRSNSL